MTTIVYSGGVLATDSRSTNQNVRHKCSECDKITTHAFDDRQKIKVPSKINEKVKFRGELVRAITGAGSAREIDHGISLLFRGRDIEQIYKSISDYRLLRPKQRFLLIGDCRFVILTNKALYTMMVGAKAFPTIEKFSLQEDAAFGTGGDAAMLAMQLFSCSATDAVKAAIIADKFSGGKVTSFNVRRPKDGVKEELVKGAALQKFAESLSLNVKALKKAAPKKKTA